MINIDFYKNGFIVKDHASYDIKGQDIVCAGVSSVVMGSLNWFENKDINEVIVDANVPIIKLSLKTMNQKNLVALELIKTQLLSIEEEYKDYLNIKIHEQTI